MPEEVSRFLATTAEVQLQQPEITGTFGSVACNLCEHGGRRSGDALRACAAGAGGRARARWSAAGPLVVRAARIRRVRLCRGRSPAGLVFPLRPMLLGAGLCGAGRARAAAGA